jgi:hypothetical protein
MLFEVPFSISKLCSTAVPHCYAVVCSDTGVVNRDDIKSRQCPVIQLVMHGSLKMKKSSTEIKRDKDFFSFRISA